MIALTIQNGAVSVREHPRPTTPDGWAVVRVRAALLTREDLASGSGHIPGRWWVGEVESSPDPDLVGKRVVVDPDISDPGSPFARQGMARLDPERAVLGLGGLDGGAAQLVVAPVQNLCEVPDAIDDEHAVLAGALGSAVHVSRIERVEGKTFVTVIGDSLDALCCAQLMSAQNASVRLLTANAHRLELCTRWGVKHRHIDQAGRRADQDLVIVASAEDDALSTAAHMARPRGAVMLLGDAPRSTGFDRAALERIVSSELRVLGVSRGLCRDGIGALTSGTLDPSGLVTKRVKLKDAQGIESVLRDPSTISVLVTND